MKLIQERNVNLEAAGGGGQKPVLSEPHPIAQLHNNYRWKGWIWRLEVETDF